ncbi:vWA domain-containing protein [Methylotenera sp.]|jgi:mxaL protein|uniref:vWA domain-containing protein n=1 Tax=Methylotenera sp. TaxID=2051956 RepID=UPI00271AFD13|nr:vWA domain-containing protein [Methylotenera sp.]MDO9203946.1 VWA domain-containing protein [Methylotenera sp.]MDO9393963.1 VWA domain-containing protein [Methylotenera sp.]MDP1522425.1 VWA domain-containing protein [Methylotenera sp.]MDP2072485.1 VWA domain-containing protein [Methylotenera sp.]MDP2229516.1 VWA domain-containing protein [Methylotenera sp.]
MSFLMRFVDKLSKFDWRGRLLFLAIILLATCLFKPQANLPKRVFDWFIVLDITQSMNVRDMAEQDKAMSRLAYSKRAIRASLKSLPCGSRVAIGLFTERHTTTVTHPMEVCAHFGALDETVAHIDWRMAWAADSFIINGLFSAIMQTPKLNSKLDKDMRLAFITDGHQAPPINPDYAPKFEGKVGEVKGSIFGVGDTTPARIPKVDADDNISAYWELEEVMRYATFGVNKKTQSALDMENEQHGRNSPHGKTPAESTNAHLSALDENNLKALAKVTGLGYWRLGDVSTMADVLTSHKLATWRKSNTDLRAWFAIPAMLLVLLFFVPDHLLQKFYKQLIQPFFKRKAK